MYMIIKYKSYLIKYKSSIQPRSDLKFRCSLLHITSIKNVKKKFLGIVFIFRKSINPFGILKKMIFYNLSINSHFTASFIFSCTSQQAAPLPQNRPSSYLFLLIPSIHPAFSGVALHLFSYGVPSHIFRRHSFPPGPCKDRF